MPITRRTLTIATLVFVGICSTAAAASAQQLLGGVRGAVTDGSGGVLPGVSVVATGVAGRILATTITDAAGVYRLSALPDGPVRLTFELDGFATAVVALLIQPGTESHLSQRLGLATIAETVDVVGKAPVDLPPPPPPTPPRPAYVIIPVANQNLESICGPAKPDGTTESLGTILSRRTDGKNVFYAEGDELIIDAGTLNGLDVGRNLVVRRYYRVSGAGRTTTGEHTSGLVQIVAADERTSLAIVVYSCDELMKGDFLASFKPEPIRSPDPLGIPAYDNAARILFADAGQMIGVPRRLMVIDRGSDHGIRAGQRLTLFRREVRGGIAPAIVGDAIVVAVRADSATIRVESANDAISFGDWAAPQRYSPASLPVAAALAPQPF